MLKDSLNKKTYIGDIEPNPKEFGIWIKEDGSAKIYDYVKNEWKGSSSNNDGGEASNIEYLDVSGMSYEKMDLIFNSYLVRFIYDNKVQVAGGASLITIGDIESALTGVVAVAIDFNSLIIKGGDEIDTVLEDLIHSFTQEQLDAIPRLTKEQFYSLES